MNKDSNILIYIHSEQDVTSLKRIKKEKRRRNE